MACAFGVYCRAQLTLVEATIVFLLLCVELRPATGLTHCPPPCCTADTGDIRYPYAYECACAGCQVFTEYELDLYQELTGLTRAEILHAYRKFHDIDPLAFLENKKGRLSFVTVADSLAQLAVNPFRYRICQVFCANDTGFMDFDDFLEMVMIMSDRTSLCTKLPWAFQIYDFNEDDAICAKDLNKMMDMLTGGKISQKVKDNMISHVLRETDLDNDGAMSFQEFERVITLKSGPEFLENFRFVL